LEEICGEKAGIIKPSVSDVVIGPTVLKDIVS
jgi:folylpolyglutamate synthase/dihydropteroate synthase